MGTRDGSSSRVKNVRGKERKAEVSNQYRAQERSSKRTLTVKGNGNRAKR